MDAPQLAQSSQVTTVSEVPSSLEMFVKKSVEMLKTTANTSVTTGI